MTNNVYGIDLGTCNMKIYCKASNKIMNEKNTIALVNKNEMYAYGDDAYAMYEKAPETIQVTFPVVGGVIADFNNLQVMLRLIWRPNAKGKLRGAEFIVAVPTDITDVEKRAFFDMFYKSKLKPKSVLLCEKPIADAGRSRSKRQRADRYYGGGHRCGYHRDFRHLAGRTGLK